MNYTAWVNAADGLCIRDSGSASAGYITTEPYGTALTVTGEVLKNGVDIGWRRVTDGRGITGYCSAQFLSNSEIIVKKAEEKPDLSGYPQTVAIYCAGDLRHVEYFGDGKYIDEEGNLYTALASCTTFVRDSDGVTYCTAEAAGINPDEWN